jgi:hypothetical protein
MLRQLALASFILLTPSMGSAQTASFQIEEATIEDIQAAVLRGELTSTRVVQFHLNRIKAYKTARASISRMGSLGSDRSHLSRMRINSMLC